MNKIIPANITFSHKHNDQLYKLYNMTRLTPDITHNLIPHLKIPFYVKLTLNLGLSFSIPCPPKFNKLKFAFNDALRKIGWIVHFNLIDNRGEFNTFDSIIHKINKCNRLSKTVHSDEESILFPANITKCFLSQVLNKYTHKPLVSTELIRQVKQFMINNNIMIKPADKNAGICIMSLQDYNSEIIRQLDDCDFYFPSTQVQFRMAMESLADKIRCHSRSHEQIRPSQGKFLKLSKLLPVKYDAAKFYILPKIHKEFENFPKGRPISSTCQTLTKGLSQILDKFLQPIMNHVPNLILDTSHFLVLLSNLKLDPNSKYALVTIDIESLYTNLKTKNCKIHCCRMYDEYKNLCNFPYFLHTKDLYTLMGWCLDHHYLRHNNDFYIQHKGIAMGGAASVSIANISVFNEMNQMLNQNEIAFKVRFIDDIFIILNVNNITNVPEWISNATIHEYLKFTYEYSYVSINFLDVQISLEHDNHIITGLYSKPMNKHQYLHYESNHPIHCLKSIPYSQGARIKRICSNKITFQNELEKMISKFQARMYPSKLLNESLLKLSSISRDLLLKPKTNLIRSNLRIHHPEILEKFNIKLNEFNECKRSGFNNKIFIVMPFYKNILGFNRIIKNTLKSAIIDCENLDVKNAAMQLTFVIAYCKDNNLKQLL